MDWHDIPNSRPFIPCYCTEFVGVLSLHRERNQATAMGSILYTSQGYKKTFYIYDNNENNAHN